MWNQNVSKNPAIRPVRYPEGYDGLVPAKLRVSVVKYLNTAPLTWGIEHGPTLNEYTLSFTTPACCAEDLRVGRADLGIVPSIEYQRIDGLKILPGISI